MKYSKNYNDFLNEDQDSLNERKVKLTKAHKSEMLKIAKDLRKVLEAHEVETGTGFFGDKMQDRDALYRAANVLESFAKYNWY
jgi:virulence-associated protein VapD